MGSGGTENEGEVWLVPSSSFTGALSVMVTMRYLNSGLDAGFFTP